MSGYPVAVEDAAVPHDLEAERAVLGVILVWNERLFDVADTLAPTDFFRQAHQWVYAAMLALTKVGRPIDRITLCEQLRHDGRLDDAGGPAYLASLMDGTPRSTNIEYYAEIVRNRATMRQVVALAQRVSVGARAVTDETEDFLATLDRDLTAITQRTIRGDFVPAETLAADGMALVDRLLEGGQCTTGLRTGFLDFDHMTRGLQPGNLILLAARPSMGKSSFALNVAHYVAAHGQTVGFFSLEMSRQELTLRLLASVGRIDGHRLQGGRIHQGEYGRLGEAFSEIGNSGLFVDDTASLSALDLRGKTRRLKARHGLGLVVLDYLQLMAFARAENRNLAVAEASRALKLLARELEVPVIALSQLSRETERSSDKKPMLSHLRDSGALEQDADLVLFLHRPEVYAPTPENEGVAELIIAKHRNGPIGSVDLRWDKTTTRFDSLEAGR